MNSFSSVIHQQLFVHDQVWVVLHWSHPSTVVSCIIWYCKTVIDLVHQQLYRTLSGMDSFSSLIHQQLLVHDLEWVVFHWSLISTVVSCIIWYGFLYLSCPSTVILYIIWYGKFFVGLIDQQLFRTSSDMDFFSSLIHQQFFVHDLVWVVLHWSQPSTVVPCIIWYEFLYLSCPSGVVLYIIWYGKFFVGLIHQQLFRTSSDMESFSSLIHPQLFVHHLVWVVLHWSHPSTVFSCIFWYGKAIIGLIHQLLFCTLSGMDSFSSHPSTFVCTWSGMGSSSLISSMSSCFVHHLVWISLSVLSISSCFVHHLVW